MKSKKYYKYLMFKNKLISLEQIYNFTCEYPFFSQKTNLEKIFIFCANIQDPASDKKILINDKNKITLTINKKEITLSIIDSPAFNDKGLFINWIFHKIFSST